MDVHSKWCTLNWLTEDINAVRKHDEPNVLINQRTHKLNIRMGQKIWLIISNDERQINACTLWTYLKPET